MNRYICERCGRIDSAQTRVELREITLPIQDDSISLTTPTRICSLCESPVYDRSLDNSTLERAYELYRRKNDIISPEEVRELREKYAISQRNLALLLGWSEATINRYEKGAAPDRAHSVVLRLLRDPCDMRDLLDRGGHVLPGMVRDSLRRRLTELIDSGRSERLLSAMIEGAHTGPDILTGYRPFSPDKLREMALFFARDGIYETKLHKELWYADFSHFHRETVSISGESYVRNHYGPTLREYPLLDDLRERGELACDETFDENGSPRGRKYRALRPFDSSIFSASELAVMERIRAHFTPFTCERISQVSHEEVGWLKTEQGQLISYDFAHQLKAV